MNRKNSVPLIIGGSNDSEMSVEMELSIDAGCQGRKIAGHDKTGIE